MYPSCYDGKGNSCLKLGSSKSAGTFKFTVPEDITKVEIYAAKYKANTSKVTINGGASQTLTNSSNDGNYDILTVDTLVNKEITFATATGGLRCMVNTIKFFAADAGGDETDTPDTPTDESLVASALSSYSVNTFYSASGDYELPTSSDDIQFTYEVTTDNATDFAVDEDGLLSVNPTNSLKKATLTVTATLNDASDSKDIEIASLLKDSELTIANAIEAAKHFGTTESTDRYYVSGTITEIKNKTYGNVIIQDGTGSMLVYGLYKDGVRYDKMDIEPIVGDEIQVYGQLINYNGDTPEVTGDPELIKHKENTSRIDRISGLNTEFSLSFDYALTYKEEEVEGTGVETTASLSFADKAQRTSYSISQQVWEQNGIKLTGKKAESSTSVGDYANPARFYASSSIEIEVAEGCTISKIVFTTAGSSYATPLKDSIGSGATVSGSDVTYVPTSESNSFVIAKLTKQVQMKSLSVTYVSAGGTVEVVDTQAYANVGLTFGAKVTSSLFEGYTKVSGGVMIDNAANYTNTTIAEAYANGEFKGITTSKESLKLTDDGFYSVGSTIEVIDGLVDENNKKYLSYEFVAAVYFTLENAEGTTTVVLEQKAYSVSTMVDYYLANSSGLGLNDETVKVVEAFDAFIG